MEKNSRWMVLVILVVLILFISAFYYINKTTIPHTRSPIINISIGGSPYIGNSSAKIVIVDFSDFECPYCGKFFRGAFKDINERYVKTGKAVFVYKNFPLEMHTHSRKAAEASLCANEQGRFWDYHDKLFSNQDALTVNDLKIYARELSLDTNKFNDCLDSGKIGPIIENEIKEGKDYGVSGTPTIFINGIKIVGAQPFDIFKRTIEEELNK